MNTRSRLVFASVLSLCLAGALTLGTASKTNEDREVVKLEHREIEYSLFRPEVREAELSVLRGLKGVFVSVDELCKDIKEAGLAEKDILELVQSRLQKENVRVLSKEEVLQVRGRPNICIVAKINKDRDSDLYAVSISLQLREDVFLERESGGHMSSCVSRQVSELGLCRRAELKERIKNDVARCAERFAKEFVSANSAAEKSEREEPMISGTVRYLEIEGGFYGLVADDGTKYNPINLPAEYKKNGLRVKFAVREKKGVVSFRMWGKIVEVVKIQKIAEENEPVTLQ